MPIVVVVVVDAKGALWSEFDGEAEASRCN
jgi:hypothetical protein